jgi:hypothetical protein
LVYYLEVITIIIIILDSEDIGEAHSTATSIITDQAHHHTIWEWVVALTEAEAASAAAQADFNI